MFRDYIYIACCILHVHFILYITHKCHVSYCLHFTYDFLSAGDVLHAFSIGTRTEGHRILPARLRALNRSQYVRIKTSTESMSADNPSPTPDFQDYHPAPFTPAHVPGTKCL